MKKLLITLLLISPSSFALWDVVYYCQMTTYSRTSLDGERTDLELEKFSFKVDKTKNAMVFGGESRWFGDGEMGLIEGSSYVLAQAWRATSGYDILYFEDETLVYATIGPFGIFSISADCAFSPWKTD